MIWTICFTISVAIAAITAALSIFFAAAKRKGGRLLTPLNTLLGGLFISVFVSMLPIYAEEAAGGSFSAAKNILFSLLNTFQIFTINSDRSAILERIMTDSEALSAAYTIYLSFIYVIAPILTFGFIISFFKSASAYIKYLLCFFKDMYIFSDLNQRSLALGADIKRTRRGALIIYADAFANMDEKPPELIEQAGNMGAICFKKDITDINLRLHSKSSQVRFVTIKEDEQRNIEHSLKLISAFRNRSGTWLYAFSTSIESELLLANIKGAIKVRRINEIRTLINRILYTDGYENGRHVIFKGARPADGSDCRTISAMIVGMGRHGTEMVKALAWFCQMDGYRLEIDAFDSDELAKDKFAALCPELMSEEYNGKFIEGEANYTIRIHPGVDVTTRTFQNMVTKNTSATYAFVALGSDEANIRTAAELRMLFERMKIHPDIQTIVYSTEKKNSLKGIKNFKGAEYGIDFIDMESTYSDRFIIQSKLEEAALELHCSNEGCTEENFWGVEYNYRSSVASAIHRKAREACGISEGIEPEVEHRRWNAYMRSAGYIFNETRNDLGKMHHDLIDYSSLLQKEVQKDINIVSAGQKK